WRCSDRVSATSGTSAGRTSPPPTAAPTSSRLVFVIDRSVEDRVREPAEETTITCDRRCPRPKRRGDVGLFARGEFLGAWSNDDEIYLVVAVVAVLEQRSVTEPRDAVGDRFRDRRGDEDEREIGAVVALVGLDPVVGESMSEIDRR